jgi:hypothetical protein
LGKYLDIINSAAPDHCTRDISDQSDQRSLSTARDEPFGRLCRFGRTPPALVEAFEALERRCPEGIEQEIWHQAVEDGRRFLNRWGDQAHPLGWTSEDLFGLDDVPINAASSYRRLSRYDKTGLIWLLRGWPVLALTRAAAAIKTPTGAILTYRKSKHGCLGPEDCNDALPFGELHPPAKD